MSEQKPLPRWVTDSFATLPTPPTQADYELLKTKELIPTQNTARYLASLPTRRDFEHVSGIASIKLHQIAADSALAATVATAVIRNRAEPNPSSNQSCIRPKVRDRRFMTRRRKDRGW